MTYLVRSTFQAHPFHLVSPSAWPISTSISLLALTPQFYYNLLQTLLSRVYNSLEWGLNSPPKPHALTSLALQSNSPYIVDILTSLFMHVMLGISGCITLYILYLPQETIKVSNKTFFKCLFKNLISHPYQFIFKSVLFIIISFSIRTMVFYSLGIHEGELFTYLMIVFSTILPVLCTYHIVIKVLHFICNPITFAPFIIKNGVVIYMPVFNCISFSISEELYSSINIRNIVIILTLAVFGYHFKPLLYVIPLYHYLGFSVVEFMSNFTYNSETELSTSPSPLVNYCEESATSSSALPITHQAESSTTPLKSSKPGTQIEVKQSNKDSLTVDVSFVQSQVFMSGKRFFAVYDRLDPTCTNLKGLYPGTSVKVVDVPEVGDGVKGLRFSGSNNQWKNSPEAVNSSQFKQQPVPNQQNRSTIHIPRAHMQIVEHRNVTVLSLGHQIGISANGRSYIAVKNN